MEDEEGYESIISRFAQDRDSVCEKGGGQSRSPHGLQRNTVIFVPAAYEGNRAESARVLTNHPLANVPCGGNAVKHF
jgi:hypothetical protein